MTGTTSVASLQPFIQHIGNRAALGSSGKAPPALIGLHGTGEATLANVKV
jgi:hypothetical protein